MITETRGECVGLVGSREDTPSAAGAAHCYAWADAMLRAPPLAAADTARSIADALEALL